MYAAYKPIRAAWLTETRQHQVLPAPCMHAYRKAHALSVRIARRTHGTLRAKQ